MVGLMVPSGGEGLVGGWVVELAVPRVVGVRLVVVGSESWSILSGRARWVAGMLD